MQLRICSFHSGSGFFWGQGYARYHLCPDPVAIVYRVRFFNMTFRRANVSANGQYTGENRHVIGTYLIRYGSVRVSLAWGRLQFSNYPYGVWSVRVPTLIGGLHLQQVRVLQFPFTRSAPSGSSRPIVCVRSQGRNAVPRFIVTSTRLVSKSGPQLFRRHVIVSRVSWVTVRVVTMLVQVTRTGFTRHFVQRLPLARVHVYFFPSQTTRGFVGVLYNFFIGFRRLHTLIHLAFLYAYRLLLKGFGSHAVNGCLRHFNGDVVLVLRRGYGGVTSHSASGTMVRLFV